MWDEVKGYVVVFLIVPFALGGFYYLVYRGVTGEWPNPPRTECFTDYDGVRNPSVCD